MMNKTTLIDDVLSYLPNWGVTPEDENHDKLKEYEHSYSDHFLPPTDAHKDQLDVAKWLSAKEILQEVERSENYIKNYTHREYLPDKFDIYDSLCKYTAGSLYLKYNLSTKSKVHGYSLRKEAIEQIEPYVVIKVKPICGKPRKVKYPKWFNYTYPPHCHHEEFYDYHHHRGEEDGHHVPCRPFKKIRHKKPFILVTTFQKIFRIDVSTFEQPRLKAVIKTKKARKRSKCNPWYARKVW